MKHSFALIASVLLTFGFCADHAFAQRGNPDGVREKMGGRAHTDIQGRDDNGPKVGDFAPDFQLLPLKFYEFGIDDADITKENAGNLYAPVRLSSFKGKKPVVLIFGSYT